MPLTKSTGNMYDWVTHTHCHLGGQCPHGCSYCYVDNPRFGRPAKYKGELRLIEDEFKVSYRKGNTIFLENNNDLFAYGVPIDFINRIMAHCCKYPDNTYVFQTKNPVRLADHWFGAHGAMAVVFPQNCIIGCTIESDLRHEAMGDTCNPMRRAGAMSELSRSGVRTFITIEPILDIGCVATFAAMIRRAMPGFVNIGADSKGHNLPEPPIEKVNALIAALTDAGIEIRQKRNLDRLAKRQEKK